MRCALGIRLGHLGQHCAEHTVRRTPASFGQGRFRNLTCGGVPCGRVFGLNHDEVETEPAKRHQQGQEWSDRLADVEIGMKEVAGEAKDGLAADIAAVDKIQVGGSETPWTHAENCVILNNFTYSL